MAPTSGRHHHRVGQGRLAPQIDRNDILGFGVIEAVEYRPDQRVGLARITAGRRMRLSRGREICRVQWTCPVRTEEARLCPSKMR